MAKHDNYLDKYDNIFWYVLYGLPVIVFLVINFKTQVNSTFTLIDAFNLCATAQPANIIISTILEIFGVDGVLPIIDLNFALVCGWFISVYLVHLAVDVILFIPRFAHKLIGRLTE